MVTATRPPERMLESEKLAMADTPIPNSKRNGATLPKFIATLLRGGVITARKPVTRIKRIRGR